MTGVGKAMARSAETTAPALDGDAAWVCLDCDALQVEPTDVCPACGGVVAARMEPESKDVDPMIGRKIGGRFVVLARLGAGSMGAVYRARQAGMSRQVALKVLKPERALDAGAQQRFEREARATSALTSPHTVTVFDFGEDESNLNDPLLYLAMELLDGEPLSSRMRDRGRLTPLEAVRIIQQTLRSLAEAHDKGVIHRDLKPDNIFLHRVPTPHGTEEMVKVLDFGIAKIVQPDLKVDSLETQAGTVFGTPRYMSPEQAQSKPLDGRSDLYAAGLILFQMVTGRHVFTDDDAVVVMARHIQSLPPRPREIAPDAGISRRLEAVILRTLAKDPKRRPQSAQELHDELEAALQAPDDASSGDISAALPVASSGTLQASTIPNGPTAGSNIPSFVPVADASIETRAQGQRRSMAPTSRRSKGRRAFFVIAGAAALLLAVGVGARIGQNSGPAGSRPLAHSEIDNDKPSIDRERTTPKITTADEDLSAEPSSVAMAPSVTASATSHASGTSAATSPRASKTGSPSHVAATTAEPGPTASATTAAPTPSATTKKPKYGKFE
ncbi:MAG: serine/threonine-protein kinase [Polyangiales bacterium]